jgi:hypothetical protein
VAEETPGNSPETPLETLSDRELILRIARVAEHLDPMVHEIHQLTARAAPLLDRFAHPGRLIFGTGKKGAPRGD